MAFDGDKWRAEHPAWSVTLDGFTFRARPVSARAIAAVADQLQGVTHFAAMERLLRLAFPWRPSYSWRGDPVKKILAMGPKEYRAICDDFFVYLGLRESPTPGNSSQSVSPLPAA